MCLFVRAENAPAIRLYEAVGMRARARLPQRAVVRTLLLVRHAHARSNARRPRQLDCLPARGSPSRGSSEARALGEELAASAIDLGVATRLARTQETLELALGGRDVDAARRAALDEIRFGAFEGGPLGAYRAWAWSHAPDAPCPGGGESRAERGARLAAALEALLERPEESSSPSGTRCRPLRPRRGRRQLPGGADRPGRRTRAVRSSAATPSRAPPRRSGRGPPPRASPTRRSR